MSTGRVKPYEGIEPYIFISYSHRDYDRVQPILQGLAAKGYRLWYDEGIDPGTEWPESIANHLGNSAACLAFISPHSASSRNCRREINFTLTRNIELLTIFLEPTKISSGLEMQISTYQSIMGYKYPDLPSLLDRIVSMEALDPCRGTPDATLMVGGTYGPAAAGSTGKRRGTVVIAVLLILVLIAAGAWSYFRLQRGKSLLGVDETTLKTTLGPTAEPIVEPTAAGTATPLPRSTPEPYVSEEEDPYGRSASYFDTKYNYQDHLWDDPPIRTGDPLPDGYREMVYGEWGYGSLLVFANEEGNIRFALTDDRIPDGFPLSQTPGKNEMYWNVMLKIGRGDILHVVIDDNAGTAISFADMESSIQLFVKNTFRVLGGFPYSLTGNTFLFEMDLPEQYTVDDIYGIDVSLGTEIDNYVDAYEFYV